METVALEKYRVPTVLLWGTDLFQGYRDESVHFPPSPLSGCQIAWLTFIHG